MSRWSRGEGPGAGAANGPASVEKLYFRAVFDYLAFSIGKGDCKDAGGGQSYGFCCLGCDGIFMSL